MARTYVAARRQAWCHRSCGRLAAEPTCHGRVRTARPTLRRELVADSGPANSLEDLERGYKRNRCLLTTLLRGSTDHHVLDIPTMRAAYGTGVPTGSVDRAVPERRVAFGRRLRLRREGKGLSQERSQRARGDGPFVLFEVCRSAAVLAPTTRTP